MSVLVDTTTVESLAFGEDRNRAAGTYPYCSSIMYMKKRDPWRESCSPPNAKSIDVKKSIGYYEAGNS